MNVYHIIKHYTAVFTCSIENPTHPLRLIYKDLEEKRASLPLTNPLSRLEVISPPDCVKEVSKVIGVTRSALHNIGGALTSDHLFRIVLLTLQPLLQLRPSFSSLTHPSSLYTERSSTPVESLAHSGHVLHPSTSRLLLIIST